MLEQLPPSILHEWREPRHDAFEERNVWSLINSFTEALKDGNLNELPKRTEALHGLLDIHVGLIGLELKKISVPLHEGRFSLALNSLKLTKGQSRSCATDRKLDPRLQYTYSLAVIS